MNQFFVRIFVRNPEYGAQEVPYSGIYLSVATPHSEQETLAMARRYRERRMQECRSSDAYLPVWPEIIPDERTEEMAVHAIYFS